MRRVAINPDMSVDEIMQRWPSTIHVLIRHGMLCIGCPIGVFHTISDACAAHGVGQEEFEAELLAAMRGDPSGTPSAFLEPREIGDPREIGPETPTTQHREL